MGWLIRADNDIAYRTLAAFLMERYPQHIRVMFDKRRMLSVEDLPREALNTIPAAGASVTEEFQYELEAHRAAAQRLGERAYPRANQSSGRTSTPSTTILI